MIDNGNQDPASTVSWSIRVVGTTSLKFQQMALPGTGREKGSVGLRYKDGLYDRSGTNLKSEQKTYTYVFAPPTL